MVSGVKAALVRRSPVIMLMRQPLYGKKNGTSEAFSMEWTS